MALDGIGDTLHAGLKDAARHGVRTIRVIGISGLRQEAELQR